MRRLLRPALVTSTFVLFLTMGLALSPRSQAPNAEAAHPGTIIHVDSGASSSGDGTSGSPFQTIAEGILHAATSGDTIRLAEGTYSETVTIDGKILTIDGDGFDPATGSSVNFTVENAGEVTILTTDAPTVLAGFTTTSGENTIFTFSESAGVLSLSVDPTSFFAAVFGSTVAPPNSIVTFQFFPMAVPDEYTVARGGTLTVPAGTGVLANDIDPQGDTLTATHQPGLTSPSNPNRPTLLTITSPGDGSFS